jgi:ferredoxin
MNRARAKLVANGSKCDGHGICVLRSPDLLTLDAWGFVGVDSDEPLTGRDLRRAKSAVAACPERALSLVTIGAKAGTRVLSGADSSPWPVSAPHDERLALPGGTGADPC